MTDDEILAFLDDRYEDEDRVRTLAEAARDGNPIAGIALGRAVLAGELVRPGTASRPKQRPRDVEGPARMHLCWMQLRIECGMSRLEAADAIALALADDDRQPGRRRGVMECIKRHDPDAFEDLECVAEPIGPDAVRYTWHVRAEK